MILVASTQGCELAQNGLEGIALQQMENQLVAVRGIDDFVSTSLMPRLPGVELFLAKRSGRIDRRSAQCRQRACDTSDHQERDEGTEQHHRIMRAAGSPEHHHAMERQAACEADRSEKHH